MNLPVLDPARTAPIVRYCEREWETLGPTAPGGPTWLLIDSLYWRTPDLESAVIFNGWCRYCGGQRVAGGNGRAMAAHPEITASGAELLALYLALNLNRTAILYDTDPRPLMLCFGRPLAFKRALGLSVAVQDHPQNIAKIERYRPDLVVRDVVPVWAGPTDWPGRWDRVSAEPIAQSGCPQGAGFAAPGECPGRRKDWPGEPPPTATRYPQPFLDLHNELHQLLLDTRIQILNPPDGALPVTDETRKDCYHR